MGKEMLYKLRKVCYNKLKYYPNGKAGAAKAGVWQIFVKPVHQSGVLPFADGSGVAAACVAFLEGLVACMVFRGAWALAACGLSQDARIFPACKRRFRTGTAHGQSKSHSAKTRALFRQKTNKTR